MTTDTIIKTFISYSHDSEDHKRLVLSFANQLCIQGIDCSLDQYIESPEEGWAKWMETELVISSYVLVICTKGYYDKLTCSSRGVGKGVRWEGSIITNELYEHNSHNRRFIPIIFGEENIANIPRMLKQSTYYDVLDKHEYEKLYRRLTQQPTVKKPSLGKIIPFPTKKIEKYIPRQAATPYSATVKQAASGNNNIQVGVVHGKVEIKVPKTPKITILPTPGTIRSNSLLKQAIEERFNRLGEEREKRFGKQAYIVMYNKFKSDLEIKNNKWTVIWDWPEATGEYIISYLDQKYKNTIAGRIKESISKGKFIPSRGHLYAQEKDLLAQIGLEMSDQVVKDYLSKYFGVTSHTKLTGLQHWQWVMHLEKVVKAHIDEL